MTQIYNNPSEAGEANASTIGTQFNTFWWHKKALIEAKKDMYFMPLADVLSMPKHYGKEIKVYHYIPLLDDRNTSDQGISASGAVITAAMFYANMPVTPLRIADAGSAAAKVLLDDNVGTLATFTDGANGSGGGATTLLTQVGGTLSLLYSTEAKVDALVALDMGITKSSAGGNLYGSSKDVGSIQGKIPTLTETGGRVNRVGFTRIERSGSIAKFGFFTEFTQESFDFDSDSELYGHLSREMVTGATQLTEAVLQADLLAGCGTVLYTGEAVSDLTVSGETTDIAVVDNDDFMRLSIMLDENRTPKTTKYITGSRMIDTKTIAAGRVMYIGTELQMQISKLQDSFGDAAFVPIHQYGHAGTIMNGEIGTIGQFRLVVVPEMLHWAGAGATVGTNPGYRASGDHYNIYPMLVIGAESFTTIGFQTDGKTVKFKIITKMPGVKTADKTDPFGEVGFSSIKWYYGMLIMRPERLAVIKTLATV
ncbi:MAG: N4-gp56 family major capsid protein [Flavobacteriales bacterium]|nr:N4-gp56 family major capsid protein [Flavobacteriales bacterium]